MQGTMIWFNVDKGHGYIRTEDDERLLVARSGFRPGHEPAPGCKGRTVSFERQVVDGEPSAVDVAFVDLVEPRRARLRSARGGRAI